MEPPRLMPINRGRHRKTNALVNWLFLEAVIISVHLRKSIYGDVRLKMSASVNNYNKK
jgi:hypothetical protein